MKKRKILLGLALTFGAMISLSACDNGTQNSESSSNQTVSATTNNDTPSTTNSDNENTNTNTTTTVSVDEIDYKNSESVSDIKATAKKQSAALANDSSLTTTQKIYVNLASKYFEAKIDATTETDPAKLKIEINDYYKSLYDSYDFIKNIKSATKADYLKQANLLKEYVINEVNSVNIEYVEECFKQLGNYINNFDPKTADAMYNSFITMIYLYTSANISQELANYILTYKSQIKTIYDKAIKVAEVSSEIKAKVEELYKDAIIRIAAIKSNNEKDNAKTALDTFKEKLYELSDKLITYDISEYVEMATSKIDEVITPLLNKFDTLPDTKKALTDEKDALSARMNSITKLEDMKTFYDGLSAELTEFVSNIISVALKEGKDLLIAEISDSLDKFNNTISNETLKARISTYEKEQLDIIGNIEKYDDIAIAAEQIKANTVTFIKEITAEEIKYLKSTVISYLDTQLDALIAKISDEDLKSSITTFKNQELKLINDAETLDDVKRAVDTIKKDIADFAKEILDTQLAKYKNAALAQLDTLVNEGITKLPSDTLKTELRNFYSTEKTKIEAATIDTISSVTEDVINDTKLEIKKLVASTLATTKALMKTYITNLANDYKKSPYDYIPAAMKSNYGTNLITNPSDITYDFTDFVNVSSINYGGFGEQWHMVADNINQVEKATKVLTASNAVINTIIAAANEYLDDIYSDSLEFEKDTESYYLYMNFVDGVLIFNATYKSGVTIPLFGSVTPTIEMTFDSSNSISDIYIQLTNTNKLRYTVSANSFEFGIQYGVDAGSRTSKFELSKENSKTIGHIYEYSTVKGKTLTTSCADFYIEGNYVSVIGNKANAITGMKGYINELYSTSAGKLLGYKVLEEEEKTGTKYHTLWFNMTDISEITSIRINEDDKKDKSTIGVYLNGSTTLFAPTYNKKFGVKTSRKYDIEFRTRYFYGLDADNNLVEYEIQIPMMFIQDNHDEYTNFTDYPSDISKDNNIESEVSMASATLAKIRSDYEAYINEFKENKQMMTSEAIVEFINE